jgi:hypothetical protein
MLMLRGYTLVVLMNTCRPAWMVYSFGVPWWAHLTCSYLLFSVSKFLGQWSLFMMLFLFCFVFFVEVWLRRF